MKTYFVNIDSITNEEINTIKTATEDDKIVFFYKGDGMIPMSLHIALTEINAKVVFHNVDSEAELFFYIGHEFNGFRETIILSGIDVPETIKKIICKEKTKKKRAPRTKTVKSSKEDVSPMLTENEPKNSAKTNKKESKITAEPEPIKTEEKPEQKTQKNAEEKVPTAVKDFPKKKSKKPTSYWLAGETSKSFFSGSCKLEKDFPDRENIVEIAGRCFGEEANVNEALKRLAKETSREIADVFAQNANMLTSAFKDNFNKRVDKIEY